MNYGEPESKELPIHEQVRQSRVALCGMTPLIADEATERCAGGMRLSLQPDYDRLLQSYHAAGRLARELKAALDAARKEVTDLATRCADLENERSRLRLDRDSTRTDSRYWRSKYHDLWSDFDELRRLRARLPSELPPGLAPYAAAVVVSDNGWLWDGAQWTSDQLEKLRNQGRRQLVLNRTTQPEPEQRQDAIPAPAAQQGRPVSVEPAPASLMPFNALKWSR